MNAEASGTPRSALRASLGRTSLRAPHVAQAPPPLTPLRAPRVARTLETQPGQTPGASDLCTDAPEGAPPPAGNAKTHSTPSHDDGVENKKLPSPPPPPPRPPPWASSRRPRHHIRRRLRRAARCVGAIAAAPAEHACTQRHRSVLLHARAREASVPRALLCVHGRARHGVRAHLLRSASASSREAKGARRSMANEENVWDRSVARARSMRRWVAARARAGKTRESKRISSVARALQGARRKGRADRWQMERLIGRICKPMRLKPAAAGRRRAASAEQGEAGQKS